MGQRRPMVANWAAAAIAVIASGLGAACTDAVDDSVEITDGGSTSAGDPGSVGAFVTTGATTPPTVAPASTARGSAGPAPLVVDAQPVLAEPEASFPDNFGTQFSTYAFDDLWLAGNDRILRFDPVTRSVDATMPIPGEVPGSPVRVQAVLEHDGRLWVAAGNAGLVVIDPAQNAVTETRSLGMQPYALAADGPGRLWISDFEGNSVARYDTVSDTVELRVDVPSPTGIAVAEGSVFVAQHRSTELRQLDGATGDTVRLITIGGRAENAVVAAGSVWVAVNSGRAIARIDAVTGVAQLLPVDDNVFAVGLSSDPDVVWASVGPQEDCGGRNSSVVRIDARTMEVDGRVIVPCAGFVRQIGDALWTLGDIDEALYVTMLPS